MTPHDRPPRSIEWIGCLDGVARIIDQTCLPERLTMLDINDAQTMREAIGRLRVRGAPAIGIAAAMGAVLAVRDFAEDDRTAFLNHLGEACDDLAAVRPTAVNLAWALGRIRRRAAAVKPFRLHEAKLALLDEARRLRDEDAETCHAIGRAGRPLIRPDIGVLTHCNAGALATAELGTALAPLYLAHQDKTPFRVYATETRPLLQGARLTAWELGRAGIDVTLLTDAMTGALLRTGKVDLVITGADRIAANGDVANKIGTYSLAVLADAHDVPFYVAAPASTFDLSIPGGDAIPIEYRDPEEIRAGFGRPTAPADVACYTPAFDVTPARLICAIITAHGLIQPVDRHHVATAINPAGCPDRPSATM
ncbi:MAG: S-methyl-5-thioribose-1-phosphate isomerase [Phycisphaerae bacterium]